MYNIFDRLFERVRVSGALRLAAGTVTHHGPGMAQRAVADSDRHTCACDSARESLPLGQCQTASVTVIGPGSPAPPDS